MRKNSLTSTGLSLSQAQSVSNLCYQRAREISVKLSNVNNCSKTVHTGEKMYDILTGKKLPEDVVDLLKEKAQLHACQAFLMENIKAKDGLLAITKSETADVSGIELPMPPKTIKPTLLPEVREEWGWEQLTVNEIAEFQEAEAYAAHIGQFIHQDSVLDKLRDELPKLAPIEWMIIEDGKKSPVIVRVHHTSEQLLKVHEELAGIHREHEQRVNFFKAKVKNLITNENARIAKLNADAQHDAEKINNTVSSEYQNTLTVAYEKIRTIQADFEKVRQENIKSIASLRINVHPRFQKTVNEFLKTLPAE
jgi:hypothetical protein